MTTIDMSRPQRASEDRADEIRRTLEGVIGVPATEGNLVDVLVNGDQIFPAMLDAIGEARRTIDLLTFVYWRGGIGTKFAEALSDKAGSGVRVRVLLDAWGASSIDPGLVWRTRACASDGSDHCTGCSRRRSTIGRTARS